MSRFRNWSNRANFDYNRNINATMHNNNMWNNQSQIRNSAGIRQYQENVDFQRKASKDVPCCKNCWRTGNLNAKSNICTYCLMRKKNPLIEKFQDKQLMAKYTKNFLQCSGFCAFVCLAFLIDIFLRCPSIAYPWLYRLEIILCKAAFTGIFFFLGIYYLTMRCIRMNNVTKDQKLLLGINDDDSDVEMYLMNVANTSLNNDSGFFADLKYHFKRNTNYRPCVCVICKTISCIRSRLKFRAFFKRKWQPMLNPTVRNIYGYPTRLSSTYYRSPYVNWNVSQNYYTPMSSSRLWQHPSPNYFNRSSWSRNSSYQSANASFNEDYLTNDRDFLKYLETSERRHDEIQTNNNSNVNDDIANSLNPFSSFWRHSNKPNNNFDVPVYQFSPLPVSTPVNMNNDHAEQDMFIKQSLLVKDISPDRLVQYVAKLRRWLSSTILERLCDEIEASNRIFQQCGLTDVEIGNVGLERLRKLVENREFVNRYMNNLPTLYRFLNFCPNQSYYVQRIRELSRGSCLADYNWNNMNSSRMGGPLPSDAAILFHLFCVYIDSQLLPMPQGGSERPFYSQYVILDDGKCTVNDIMKCIRNRAKCAIICNDLWRPKFSFICNNEIQCCISDCNNLFYVIIQFLIYMRNHRDGMLEGVSLGIQGINILKVIEN